MDIYHTIIRPLITEKSTAQSGGPDGAAGRTTYAFQVNEKASKAQIRDAIQKIYNVKVLDVRTLNRMGKSRRFRTHVGHSPGMKKAYVTLDEKSRIDLF